MTQCYDMHESVPTYTNYNHCAKDRQRFIRQKNEIAISEFFAQCLFYRPYYYFESSETNQVNKNLIVLITLLAIHIMDIR